MLRTLLYSSVLLFVIGLLLLFHELFMVTIHVESVDAQKNTSTLSLKEDKITPTLTPTPMPLPAITPTPTIMRKVSVPVATPTPVLETKENFSASPAESVETYLLNKVNEFRSAQGLSQVKADRNTCDFAEVRVSEITTNFNHDGFSSRLETKSLPYSSYSEVTENIAMNTDYTKVVQSWIDSPGHAENMRKSTTYVCIKQQGNYFAYEGWKP